MFMARDKSGRLYHLLKDDVPKGAYFCPTCQGPLCLRSGEKMRPHFAHLTLKDCYEDYQNESPEHLGLKALLFAHLSQEKSLEIEKPLPSIGQVADLIVNDKLVLEIQCSSLSTKRLLDRTKAYRSEGYHVEWLLGKKLWLKDRLSVLQRHFLQFSPRIGFYLWELDCDKEQLRLRYLIHEKLSGELVYLTKSCFLSEDVMGLLRFPFQAKRLSSLRVSCLRQPQAYIRKQLLYKNPKWMRQQALAYQQHQNLLLQPTEFFFPQIKPAQVPYQTKLNQPEMEHYYQEFTAYYRKQTNKSFQILYSPFFYDKIKEK